MAGVQEIRFGTDALLVVIGIDSDQVVRLKEVRPAGDKPAPTVIKGNRLLDGSLPLTDIRLAGHGTGEHKSSKTLVCGSVTSRLKYKSHRESESPEQRTLEIISYDDVTKLTVTATLVAYHGTPTLRSFATVRNDGDEDIVVSQVTSLVMGGLTGSLTGHTREWWHEFVESSATNTWFREAQWHDHDLPSIGLDTIGLYELNQGHLASHITHSLSNSGSFSTGGMLPMGMLKRKQGKETWLWQVENNGSWRWELGDFNDDIYVAVSGPTNYNHAWKECLRPGQSFTTVPAALVHVYDGIDAAFGALTTYRRKIRRKHPDNETLPIIFNDYMNCLMGDPDEEKVKSLIQPAVSAGAEYFVIDAGWYADETDWWPSVGEWEPSTRRFPSGFKSLIDTIRAAGVIPGVWVEPEVMGVRSKAVSELPPEAFFQENGKRVVEKQRYQLDYSCPAVIARMDKIIDNLILEHGIGYFKFDYNIDVANGTDANAFSSGAGLLKHNRAYLDWIQGIFNRHPELVIETCSSGGQRLDYAMLAIHPIQSTSDQQDPVRYAAVSAAIATAVTPEQSASWAYPQPDWSDEINALTVVNSLMGRVHLSGALHKLSEHQLALIREGMDIYKTIRHDIKDATPFWPLGLPKWHDDWLAMGLKAPGCRYIAVWRRGGDSSCSLPISGIAKESTVTVDFLYPLGFEIDMSWDAEESLLQVNLASTVCARLLRINERQTT
ncbi:alpha-galactosidase [Exophiala aquamarina CBS 119918]|uniref:alpha-galactosidase n=1 Tax=Exophiala aquamarina CBS 119918 TaxID=1182545 RepID=A0A072PU41_9EURO|nr:alpha-galactosidase [Exophiala aquamarina CBS 119918]KEF63624.1 alpha-galactosidase [Exophiala aquamarina CBS 119918]